MTASRIASLCRDTGRTVAHFCARISAQHASIPVFRIHGECVNAPAAVTVGAPAATFVN
jgi:hypothetical protein